MRPIKAKLVVSILVNFAQQAKNLFDDYCFGFYFNKLILIALKRKVGYFVLSLK